jgi:hypothetical protein
MNTRTLRFPLFALILVVAVFAVAPLADEGFWPYNSIPKAAIKAKYKFDVTDAWLSHLQLATVRFGGGTGSIVSPDGLVLTNHHIGLGTAQRLSTPEKDLVKNGFYAATRAEELKVAGMSLSVLQSIEDVTAKVNAGITSSMTAQDVVAARQKTITAIQAGAQAGTSKQVVSLYAGAAHHLYTYKVYSDVRFVFIVEYQTGFFGGDPDNFGYPRYCMDVAMFRLYENDKPASTPNYLKWSPAGTKEGDLVFTTGHPATTFRLNTLAHFKYRRDSTVAFSIASNEMREAATRKWMALSAENERQSTSDLFGIQNSLKNQRGQLAGLQDSAVMAKKEADEKRILAALAKDTAMQKAYADALATIEKSLATARQLDAARNFITNAAGLNSTLFTQARAIVRAAYNPPAEGARAGQRGGAPAAQGGGQRGSAGADQPNLQREKINLTESLAFMRKFLGPNHEIVTLILGDKTPEARATELIEKTRITDPEINALLRAGGKAAVDVATDPMIVLARTLEPKAQEVDKRYADEVATMQAAAYPAVGAAVMAVDGATVSSDATGTLRLSHGTVKSYLEAGKKVPPYTYVPGLYERSAQHNNEKPYDLAPSWVAARTALDPKTPFNMVTTNDIVGGNSGSAMVNKKGEIVGLVFDGNPPMLAGYYTYYEGTNRCISVDSRLIMEALRKVYKADALVNEIAAAAKKK